MGTCVRHPVHSARAARALHIHQLAALVLGLGELARVVALSVVHTLGMLNSITRFLLQMLRRALALTKQPKLPGVPQLGGYFLAQLLAHADVLVAPAVRPPGVDCDRGGG